MDSFRLDRLYSFTVQFYFISIIGFSTLVLCLWADYYSMVLLLKCFAKHVNLKDLIRLVLSWNVYIYFVSVCISHHIIFSLKLWCSRQWMIPIMTMSHTAVSTSTSCARCSTLLTSKSLLLGTQCHEMQIRTILKFSYIRICSHSSFTFKMLASRA